MYFYPNICDFLSVMSKYSGLQCVVSKAVILYSIQGVRASFHEKKVKQIFTIFSLVEVTYPKLNASEHSMKLMCLTSSLDRCFDIS